MLRLCCVSHIPARMRGIISSEEVEDQGAVDISIGPRGLLCYIK